MGDKCLRGHRVYIIIAVNDAALLFDTLQLSQGRAARTLLTPVAMGVRTSLIVAVYQTLAFGRESGYARLPPVHHAVETIVHKQFAGYDCK